MSKFQIVFFQILNFKVYLSKFIYIFVFWRAWKIDVRINAWGSAWKNHVGKNVWGSAWKKLCWTKCLAKCWESFILEKGAWQESFKTAEKVTEEVLVQGCNVLSLNLKRRQCMNLVSHVSLHISAKSSHAYSHFDEL